MPAQHLKQSLSYSKKKQASSMTLNVIFQVTQFKGNFHLLGAFIAGITISPNLLPRFSHLPALPERREGRGEGGKMRDSGNQVESVPAMDHDHACEVDLSSTSQARQRNYFTGESE